MIKKTVLAFLFLSQIVFSQSAKLDTNFLLLGDHTNFSISSPTNTTTKWPKFQDTIVAGIEIIKSGKIDTINNVLTQKFIVTSFDSGTYIIPQIEFSKKNKSTQLVLNVISPKIDNLLKDIKAPIDEPFGFYDILPWLLSLIIFLALIYILNKLIKYKHISKTKIKKEITIAADIVALRDLNELEEKELYQKGKTKQYHTKISEIIRRYIEKRFNFIALEQTTEEILVEIKNKIKVEEYTHLKIILERSDLAKFAKTKPTSAKNKQSMELAKEFVEITKQKND